MPDASGEAVLQQYYQAPRETGRETLWTEKTVQHRYEDFVLFGKVDRLDRRPDGRLSPRRVTVEAADRLTVEPPHALQLVLGHGRPVGRDVWMGCSCILCGAP